ncbi:beta-glucuronidase-like isoform X1 [Sitophilus oryzae]|uniref:Beta-glucuronidase n=1 Tax=Sitophilus oryzae TaxID=7048 RepID=A0A6J2X7U2_SITOR|nr:beta-glucuronidase-like isoform X1 [Sitophilus oryzae]
MRKILVIFTLGTVLHISNGGILPPQASSVRELLSLDGLWHFTTESKFLSNIEDANDLELNLMPVPSSYNDISTQLSLRDHVGSVWYQRKFFVPSSWESKKVWIRFGSVCYNASVVINDVVVLTHQIGHLPFAGEITSAVKYGEENVITVEVNNILTSSTVPQGEVTTLVSGRVKQTYTFDFFNYAGIDRPVVLYTSSGSYVDDILVKTDIVDQSGYVTYNISVANDDSSISQEISVLDKSGSVVASSSNRTDTLEIPNATLWWPYLMDANPGYLYKLQVNLFQNDNLIDTYSQPFGIRKLTYDNDTFTINGKNIYIKGFGRHEDSDIRGKGLDLPLIIRDHNLIKWIGANCYRTSHYPYAEEIMDLADQLGIMIIDEVPAVNTENFNNGLLENHKKSLNELYSRDKNRPSVVIWSIANEPRSSSDGADIYYKKVSDHMKSLDRSRPITIANFYGVDEDKSEQFVDIVGFNRYQAWYNNVGELDGIYTRIIEEATAFRKKHNKPVLMTEYGADSVEGLTILPSYIWSEEFQNDVMAQYFRAFDKMRSEGWFVGEMIWNFADFKTDQDIRRVGGNRKGVFTRNRQPKAAAFLLRKRYWALANKLDNATLPDDLDRYVIDNTEEKLHNEL